MKSACAIRRGDHRDRAFVLDLGRRVAATSISEIRPAPLVMVEAAYDRLVHYIFARQSDLLIASDGGVPLGFLILMRDLPDEVTNSEQAFVAYMAVEPAAQRRGIGTALLRGAEDIAQAAGLPCVSLMVTEDNTAARRLYEAAGYATERRMLTKLV